MQEFSNTQVLIGGNSVPGIFNEPSKTVLNFDLGITSTDPTVSLLASDAGANGVDSGSVLTISLNGKSYQVLGAPDSDGAGMVVAVLTEPET